MWLNIINYQKRSENAVTEMLEKKINLVKMCHYSSKYHQKLCISCYNHFLYRSRLFYRGIWKNEIFEKNGKKQNGQNFWKHREVTLKTSICWKNMIPCIASAYMIILHHNIRCRSLLKGIDIFHFLVTGPDFGAVTFSLNIELQNHEISQ